MKFISFFPQLTKVTNDIASTLFLSYVYIRAQYSSDDVVVIRRYNSKNKETKSWSEDLGLSSKVISRILKVFSRKLKEDVDIPEEFENPSQYYIPRIKYSILRMRDSHNGETVFKIDRAKYVQYIDSCISIADEHLVKPKTLFIDNNYWCGHVAELKDLLVTMLSHKYKMFSHKQSVSIINLLLREQKEFRQSGEYICNTSGAILYTQVFSYIENRICKLPKKIAFDLTWVTLEEIFGEEQSRPTDIIEYHKLLMFCIYVSKKHNIETYIQWLLANGYTFLDFFKEKCVKVFDN